MMNNGLLLWVDDEIELLKAHILFLEKKGYEVETVSNGQDALDKCSETTYDLILLDENMPGLSGLETLSRIKEITPVTPVVMVTKSEEENIMDGTGGCVPHRRRYLLQHLAHGHTICAQRHLFRSDAGQNRPNVPGPLGGRRRRRGQEPERRASHPDPIGPLPP